MIAHDHSNDPDRDPGHDLDTRLEAFARHDIGQGLDLPAPDAIRQRGRRRTQRRLAVGLSLGAVTAAALATALGVGFFGGQAPGLVPAGPPSTSATGGTEGSPSPTPSGAKTPVTEAYSGSRYGVGAKVTVNLPDGWSVRELRDYADPANVPAGADLRAVCFTDPMASLPTWLPCHVMIQYGTAWIGHEGQAWASRQPLGWYQRTDVAPCPVGAGQIDWSSTPQVVEDVQLAGMHMVERSIYRMRCTNGQTFNPEVWWDPERGVLVTDFLGHPAGQVIADSMVDQ